MSVANPIVNNNPQKFAYIFGTISIITGSAAVAAALVSTAVLPIFLTLTAAQHICPALFISACCLAMICATSWAIKKMIDPHVPPLKEKTTWTKKPPLFIPPPPTKNRTSVPRLQRIPTEPEPPRWNFSAIAPDNGTDASPAKPPLKSDADLDEADLEVTEILKPQTRVYKPGTCMLW